MGNGEMPKETIHSDHGRSVAVGWSPNTNYVVVTTRHATVEDEITDLVLLWAREGFIDDRVACEVRRAIAVHAESAPGAVSYAGTEAAICDRRQLNDLIRALRRARDAAFGRDE